MNTKKYAAVIFDAYNIVTQVEERPSLDRALKAANFFTKRRKGYWYIIATGDEEIEMYKCQINV